MFYNEDREFPVKWLIIANKLNDMFKDFFWIRESAFWEFSLGNKRPTESDIFIRLFFKCPIRVQMFVEELSRFLDRCIFLSKFQIYYKIAFCSVNKREHYIYKTASFADHNRWYICKYSCIAEPHSEFYSTYTTREISL